MFGFGHYCFSVSHNVLEYQHHEKEQFSAVGNVTEVDILHAFYHMYNLALCYLDNQSNWILIKRRAKRDAAL